MILMHVIIALTSVIYTGLMSFFPSQAKLKISYLLVTLTLVSGTYLIVTKPVHILQTCLMGLLYIGVVITGIIFTRHKLADKLQDK